MVSYCGLGVTERRKGRGAVGGCSAEVSFGGCVTRAKQEVRETVSDERLPAHHESAFGREWWGLDRDQLADELADQKNPPSHTSARRTGNLHSRVGPSVHNRM